MGLNKRQRWAIGTALLAVGVLVADQMSLLPGPASASAAALADQDAPRIVTANELVALATKLQSVCEAAPAWSATISSVRSARDPFESPWRAVEEAVQPEIPGEEPVAIPTAQSLPELTAIVTTGGRGYAVLNGKPLSVGSSRDGYTLIELTADSATISVHGAVFTLELRTKGIFP